ncbi:MAG TPA: VCBS repeat-containing protein [Pseudomonadota bacterium]|nr:VCBS repeat-containing protein [Pseudomonadota bacterium]
MDNFLGVSFQNHFSDVAIDCFLEPENQAFSLQWIATLAPPAAEAFVEIRVPQGQLQGLALGRYALLCQEVDTARRPARLQNLVLKQHPLIYNTLAIAAYSGTPEDRPIVEQLGFIDDTVIAVNSGLDNKGLPVRQIKDYVYNEINHRLSALITAGYFAEPFGPDTLVAFSKRDVLLLTRYFDNLLLRHCAGVMPADIGKCPAVDYDRPMELETGKALVATPSGSFVVRADKGGNLLQATTQPPLSWAPLPTTAMIPAAGAVKVASGDLNADGKADLVVLWQADKSQQVRVFLGQAGGFGEDLEWTRELEAGLGKQAVTVTALAVGDVDGDGCADVVIGQGLELAVLQNQQGRFVKIWSQGLDPSKAGRELTAVTVGRLAGSSPEQGPDIVAASNTPYDPTGTPPMSTLYLHAFRPQ